MVTLSKSFHRLQPFKVLVLGDFFLDMYTTGKVRRISPEAPVPVMEVVRTDARPGGAGNVALNLLALGGLVTCVGRIGEDFYGNQLKELLSLEGMDQTSLLVEKGYATPVKNRLIADSQQLLRVDSETISPLEASLEYALLKKLEILIPLVQVVALSDYGKGFLTKKLIAGVLAISKAARIPAIVDPKGTDFTKYKGATIVKPNLSEAFAAAKMPPSTPLDLVAKEIFSQSSIDLLLITRSEAGMSLFNPNGERQDFPVVSQEVKDVTGAGDTVLAVLCLGLANQIDMPNAVQLANISAGIAIERLGCVQVTLPALAERLLKYDNRTKIFDENYTYALQQVLKGKQYSLLVLPKGQTLTPAFFRAIRQFRELIVYVCDPEEEFVQFLASLSEISTIILQSEGLKHLCETIQPHQVYILEGEVLSLVEQAKTVLHSLLARTNSSPVKIYTNEFISGI